MPIDKQAILKRLEYIEAHADVGGTASPANIQELTGLIRELLQVPDTISRGLSIRFNDYLCEMKEGYDDSIVGFCEAWDVVRNYFNQRYEIEPKPTLDSLFAELSEMGWKINNFYETGVDSTDFQAGLFRVSLMTKDNTKAAGWGQDPDPRIALANAMNMIAEAEDVPPQDTTWTEDKTAPKSVAVDLVERLGLRKQSDFKRRV